MSDIRKYGPDITSDELADVIEGQLVELSDHLRRMFGDSYKVPFPDDNNDEEP